MTNPEKDRLLRLNTALWVAAMVVPVALHFSLSATRFPWPVILPFLLIGPMLASNKMLSDASGGGAKVEASPRIP